MQYPFTQVPGLQVNWNVCPQICQWDHQADKKQEESPVRTGNYKVAHLCWGCYQNGWEKAGGNHDQGSCKKLPIMQGGDMWPLAIGTDIGQDSHFIQDTTMFHRASDVD